LIPQVDAESLEAAGVVEGVELDSVDGAAVEELDPVEDEEDPPRLSVL